VRSLLRIGTKASLAVAGLIAVPVYFAALLASSLALDKPQIVGNHQLPATGSTEAKVWLAALIAPAIVLAAGLAGLLLRRHGVYLAGAAGIAVCLLLPGLSHGWIARHERRFTHGIDFIPDGSASNLSSRGEWEHASQATIASITHWTLGLAIGAVVVAALLEVRRRRGADRIHVEPPPAESTTGGAPQVTG
jgi:LPXTG-motif cell wall-anchored protein